VCQATIKLQVGFLPKFLQAMASEIFLVIAALAGLAAKSWIVFFVVLILPLTSYVWLCAKYCQVVKYERTDI
jgi:hypothetical protein